MYDLRSGAKTVFRQNLKKGITDVVSATQSQPLFGLVSELGIVPQEKVDALTKEIYSLGAALKERDQRIEQLEALRMDRATSGADLVSIADEGCCTATFLLD